MTWSGRPKNVFSYSKKGFIVVKERRFEADFPSAMRAIIRTNKSMPEEAWLKKQG
jgi:hypothetical protein